MTSAGGRTRLMRPISPQMELHETARKQQVHGMNVADLLHELHGRAAERIDRPSDLRQPEARMRSGDPMSVESSSSTPPPAQSPLTAAMMGLEKPCVFSRARLTMRRFPHVADRSPPMSAPAQNALFARSGDHDASASPDQLEPIPERRQLGQHCARHGIALGLVVDRHERDVRRGLAHMERHLESPSLRRDWIRVRPVDTAIPRGWACPRPGPYRAQSSSLAALGDPVARCKRPSVVQLFELLCEQAVCIPDGPWRSQRSRSAYLCGPRRARRAGSRRAMRADGIKRGDRVGLLSDNRIEWLEIFFAAARSARWSCRSARGPRPRSSTFCWAIGVRCLFTDRRFGERELC